MVDEKDTPAPVKRAGSEDYVSLVLDGLRSGATSLAELVAEGLASDPTNPDLLQLGSLVALIEGRHADCLRLQKRLGKRWQPSPPDTLLRTLGRCHGLPSQVGPLVERRHERIARALQYLPCEAAGSLTSWLNTMHRKWRVEEAERSVQAARTRRRKTRCMTRAKDEAGAKSQRRAKPEAPLDDLPGVCELPRPDPAIPARVEISAPDAVLTFARETAGTSPRWFELRRELARLSLLQSFDDLMSLSQVQGVEPFWYQIETVRKVLKQFRGRVLLADEVGLGKTIEAGLVLKEYLLRGMVERVLVLVPAALVGQWREEMATKFGLDFATTHDARARGATAQFWQQPRVIASIATARRAQHRAQILTQAYDIVIVDEAHHLRSRGTANYKLVDAINKRFLLLLSATPVQNNLIELYNLLTLLKPGVFKTEKEFRGLHMTPGKPRLPADPERMRDLMRDVMVRNTRALVDVHLPPRHAHTRRVVPSPAEAECYSTLCALIRREHAVAGSGRRLALQHLLSAAGSSPRATLGVVERFLGSAVLGAEWAALHERLGAVATGAKEAELIELLRLNPGEKKIVFVRHLATLELICELLARHDISSVRFDGSLSGALKDAAIDEFRDHASVLVSTEAGGEGRNLQFCNTLINFDLPWNPMAIEQRIGRIHRIGQKREVFVFNLVLKDTLEDKILTILDEKINMFELVVGEIGSILGEIDDKQDFASLVYGAWIAETESARAQALDDLATRLTGARTGYEVAKQLDEQLFGQDFVTQ